MAGILSGLYSYATAVMELDRGFSLTLNRTFIRRNSVFLATIFVGAFATEIAFDTGANKVWDQINKGRQWKDIKHRYMEAAEEE